MEGKEHKKEKSIQRGGEEKGNLVLWMCEKNITVFIMLVFLLRLFLALEFSLFSPFLPSLRGVSWYFLLVAFLSF